MLGSAPSKGEQGARGIEVSRIRLGTIQPNENIAVFNDALNTLKGSLSYLYTSSSGDHYWYDTRPTLRKTVEDRAKQFKDDDVYLETENMLRRWRKGSAVRRPACVPVIFSRRAGTSRPCGLWF